MPDPAEQLQRIHLAGFDLQTFDRFPKCVGVVRDGCVALLVPSTEGLQMLGPPGWRMGEAIGVLVEAGGRQISRGKEASRAAADDDHVAPLRRQYLRPLYSHVPRKLIQKDIRIKRTSR